jgi:hypothetical protein
VRVPFASKVGRSVFQKLPSGQSRCGGAGTLGDTVAVTKRARIDPRLLHHRAQVGVLSGLARGDDVYDLGCSGSQHVPGQLSLDVAPLEFAVTALDLACPLGAEPLEYEGLREHYYLPR